MPYTTPTLNPFGLSYITHEATPYASSPYSTNVHFPTQPLLHDPATGSPPNTSSIFSPLSSSTSRRRPVVAFSRSSSAETPFYNRSTSAASSSTSAVTRPGSSDALSTSTPLNPESIFRTPSELTLMMRPEPDNNEESSFNRNQSVSSPLTISSWGAPSGPTTSSSLANEQDAFPSSTTLWYYSHHSDTSIGPFPYPFIDASASLPSASTSPQ
eukprot:CAMPEP_0184339238 /NCGR_PEP_ID=MMETSP1089-20130417/7906_1 /TAXON_ID=38269 ORGANISM="Gloeochaete wittrockiana, Strain SAG46.84" /NCGR_SAMPLE_ID=MMETSP1089 /ASSEMBLY_ACC=CAM_ASM_000445 /LENGTH=212 /DNA_ID=CAMNT_0026666365 /DNA_START=455 /DNA_END=1090 /DNA_ORIENTATION=+